MRSRFRTPWIAAALVALGLTAATATSAEARDGCGPGFHRNFYGFCRPNLGPFFYGYRRYGWYRPRPWGYHRWGWGGGWHRHWGGGWHRRGWGGPRRFGWGGGFHRGFGGGFHRFGGRGFGGFHGGFHHRR